VTTERGCGQKRIILFALLELRSIVALDSGSPMCECINPHSTGRHPLRIGGRAEKSEVAVCIQRADVQCVDLDDRGRTVCTSPRASQRKQHVRVMCFVCGHTWIKGCGEGANYFGAGYGADGERKCGILTESLPPSNSASTNSPNANVDPVIDWTLVVWLFVNGSYGAPIPGSGGKGRVGDPSNSVSAAVDRGWGGKCLAIRTPPEC